MIVEADGYKIDFTNAAETFVFDEKDQTKPTYHGVTVLKAVDVVAEFENEYVFLEIKEYPKDYIFALKDENQCPDIDCPRRRDHFNWLKDYLKLKFRDSFLYRYAENKVDKPIHYLCLLNFDNAMNSKMAKSLKTELPIGRTSKRWLKELSISCQVLNLASWNRNFPKWPIQKL